MANVTITIKNPALIHEITRPEIYLPAAQRSIEKLTKRMERGGRGLGARNNTIRSDHRHLGATVRTTLNNPRQTGSSWQRKNLSIAEAMLSRVLNAEFKREVEAEFSRRAS